MQRHPREDPYERYPLDSSQGRYDNPPQRHLDPNQGYHDHSQPLSPYYDDAPVHQALDSSSSSSSRTRGYNDYARPYGAADAGRGYDAPAPPRHGDAGYYNGRGHSPPTAAAGLTAPAAGATAGLAYNVTDYSARDVGPEAMHPGSHIPPPPSRSLHPDASRQQYAPYAGAAGYQYDHYGNRGQPPPDQDSYSSLNPFGTPPANHSPSRSINSFGRPDSYGDEHYQSYTSNPRHDGVDLGLVDPHDIADDGDDGLNYSQRPQRSSFFTKSGSAAKPVVGAAAVGAAAGGMMGRDVHDGGASRALGDGASQEKPSAWLSKQKGGSKKCRWITIVIVFLLIVGAIVGGVVGSLVAGNKSRNKSSASASDDTKENGDLNINSGEIKALMNNPNLHKVFPGIDYTPYKTQYPDCLEDPPSQNNVTRDVAVLSQMTNKIRLYGTDCNQTEMVLHAIDQLKMKKDIKVWLGVWQDGNDTTNARQLKQMWNVLDQYGADPFEGIIVANEILFRKEMTINSLAKVLSDVRTQLASKQMNLPVATSDLGDNWTAELAKDSDYVMANIHPFFAGVAADVAASWTWTFWEGRDGQFWKTDKNKNIIAETGWPSAGGKNCGQAQTTSCEPGSVAGIKEMNRFMEDWVCDALKNGTQYFWFEAFDEPWKIRFNEKGKEWEDKWGLLDSNRKLKDGVKIPDCGGKTVS
ncbi:hypothetical protein CDD83_9657 [Cordyceps sp. RAO-2017]|nr:hypothetical protein CDD83_9657 [Cordyceps sp. RAO-2017]